MTDTPIRAAAVVVPARDEQDPLPACLAAVGIAAASVHRGSKRVHIVVVADACRDATIEVARDLLVGADATVLAVDVRRAGAARAEGLAVARSVVGADGWLATTDADTTVEPDWLARQLAAARAGWHGVAGTVRVADWSDRASGTADRSAAAQPRDCLGDGHCAVHAANLGLSALAYDRIGGAPPLAVAEDHALWTALRRTGLPVRADGSLVVTTSARRSSRAPGGFSSLLDVLEKAAG